MKLLAVVIVVAIVGFAIGYFRTAQEVTDLMEEMEREQMNLWS